MINTDFRKTKTIIIWGMGECGKATLVKLERAGIQVEAFTDGDSQRTNVKCFLDKPVYQPEEVINRKDCIIVVAVYSLVNEYNIRERIYYDSNGYATCISHRNMIELEKKQNMNEFMKKNTLKYESFRFVDRGRGEKHMVYILAGYKPRWFSCVMERIKRVVPKDYDVCICTSGKEVKELENIAEKYNWSYLTTKKNNIPLIQNIAIMCHKNAEYIWKFDEDMFIGNGYFENMWSTYTLALDKAEYNIGMIGPCIPINSYGKIKFLKTIGKLEEYTDLFVRDSSKAKYGTPSKGDGTQEIYFLGAHKWIWDQIGNFDDMSNRFSKMKIGFTICPIRFNIGAVMYPRSLWEGMDGFYIDIPQGHNGGGYDEEQIMRYLAVESKVIAVCDNVLAAHLSYGVYAEQMTDYVLKNKFVSDVINIVKDIN